MRAILKELTSIFLLGPFAGSAFLLLYVVDQGILISGLGVNMEVLLHAVAADDSHLRGL